MVDDFYLYILMRNDMDSLNPGKAVAQGAHAANVFGKYMGTHNSKFKKEFRKWESTRGYGTTITLAANEQQINDLLNQNDEEYPIGLIIDETYPLKDGSVTHYFPCLTCAYVFAPRKWVGINHLKLMK